MQEYQFLQHEFPPVFDHNSKILILGSFPSVKSRECQFFYGHPQTIPEKKAFLLRHGIALWDVIAECEIMGSSDSSIRNVVPAYSLERLTEVWRRIAHGIVCNG